MQYIETPSTVREAGNDFTSVVSDSTVSRRFCFPAQSVVTDALGKVVEVREHLARFKKDREVSVRVVVEEFAAPGDCRMSCDGEAGRRRSHHGCEATSNHGEPNSASSTLADCAE